MLFDRVVRMRFDSDIVNDIDVEALKCPLNLEKNTGDWEVLVTNLLLVIQNQ